MDTLTIILSALSLALSVVSLIYSIRVHKDSVIHDTKQLTLDAFNQLQEQVLDRLNSYTKPCIAEISKDPQSAEYKELSVLMARIEHFCVGVNSSLYDLDIIKRMAGRYFINVYEKLLPMITKKREINKTEKHYDEFELFYDKLTDLYKNQITTKEKKND